MFGNRIDDSQVSLLGPVADTAFPEITGNGYDGDNTFVATARAILGPIGGKIHIWVTERDVGDPMITSDDVQPDEIVIVNCKGNYAEEVKGHETELFDGLQYNDVTSQRMSRFCGGNDVQNTWIYSSAEKRKTVVVFNNLNIVNWHRIQSLFTVYIPWIKINIGEDEKGLLLSLVDPKKRSSDYIAAVEKLADRCDLQDAAKEFYLKGFETRAFDQQRDRLQDRINQLMDRIRDLTEQLSSEYDEHARQCVLFNALNKSNGGERRELLDYFLSNKKLYVKSSDGDRVRYYVGGYIDNWDPDNFNYCFEDRDGYLFEAFDRASDRFTDNVEEFEALIRAIFIDETIKVKMVSEWRLGIGGSVTPVRDADYPARFVDYLPNPHLHYHGCMGSFEQHLQKAAKDFNYVMAVDITSYENGNIGFHDSIVVPEFIRDLIRTGKRCFELPDGSSVTNKQAVAWLKENGKA